jgi:hypothetical protein
MLFWPSKGGATSGQEAIGIASPRSGTLQPTPVWGRTFGLVGEDYDETHVLSVGHALSRIRRQLRLCSILLPGWATTRAPDSCGTNGSPPVRLRCCKALDWKYVSVVRLSEYVSESVCRIPCAAKPLLRISVILRSDPIAPRIAEYSSSSPQYCSGG